jgi:hypothetical protein
VVIDLGELPRELREAPAATVPVPWRAMLGALSIVLVALLSGAAHHAPPRPPAVIAARLSDTTFVVRDRLFVVGLGAADTSGRARTRVISGYRLPDARPAGRTEVTVAGTVVGVEQSGATLLVAYQLDAGGTQAVLAQTAGTDRPLWRREGRLAGVATADGLVLINDDHGEEAVDVLTGTVRWAVPRPADGFIAEAGRPGAYPDWLILVTDSGRLETWDSRTGRRLGAAAVPALAGRATGLIWPVGDIFLVDTGGGGFDGYRLPGLQRVWHTTADLSQSWMQTDCGTLICTFRQQRGMTALDPATGRQLWRSDRWVYAEPYGKYLLATSGQEDGDVPPVWVLDPATGRVVGDFGPWQGLGPDGDTGLLYGKRDAERGYQLWYGVLDPATRRIRLLGSADRVSGGCETSAGAMICRLVDASVAVWRLG